MSSIHPIITSPRASPARSPHASEDSVPISPGSNGFDSALLAILSAPIPEHKPLAGVSKNVSDARKPLSGSTDGAQKSHTRAQNMPGIVASRRLTASHEEWSWTSKTDVARLNAEELSSGSASNTGSISEAPGTSAASSHSRSPSSRDTQPPSTPGSEATTQASTAGAPSAGAPMLHARARTLLRASETASASSASVAPTASSRLATQIGGNSSFSRVLRATPFTTPSAVQRAAPALKTSDALSEGSARRTPALASKTKSAAAPSAHPGARTEAFATQAAHALAAALRRGDGKVSIQLAPEALGALRVEVQLHKSAENQSVVATLAPTTESARALLADSVSELTAALEARGLRVERVEIDVSGVRPQDAERAHTEPDKPLGGGFAGHSHTGSDAGGTGHDGSHAPRTPHAAFGTGAPPGDGASDAPSDSRGAEPAWTVGIDAWA